MRWQANPRNAPVIRRFTGSKPDTSAAVNRPVVALVTDAIHPYHRGGKEIRYHELTHRLAAQADVHVYTMNWWQGPRTIREDGVTYHALCRYRPLYAGERRSISQALFFALGCLRLLCARFDVLEADHMPYLQIPCLRLVATVRRKGLIVTWHEVWGSRYWREYLGRVGLAAWLMEWCAMRLPDHIIAASPQTAERLRIALRTPAKITIAPNGIDMRVAEEAIRNANPADIVVVGRLLPHKRVDMLLDSVALLRADGHPVTCRIIGDGPERQLLHDRAEALDITDAVDFRHDVGDHRQLYGLLKAARVFVSPSAREGFGIAVLEAIACGLPVVTTSDPDNLAQHLVARSSRGVVCDASAQALADAVKGLLSTPYPDTPDQETWLDEYSWDATVTKVRMALGI